MALDEPNAGFATYSANNIDVQMHPELAEKLKPLGGVAIDYIDNGPEQRGFMITPASKSQGMDCSGCGTSAGGCGDDQ